MPHRLNKTITQYYEDTLEEHGTGPAAVNWNGVESQHLRFDMLSQIGDLSTRSVHDVGCGLADYADYLARKKANCQYIGSDISPKMIEAAKKKFSDPMTLKTANILESTEPWMRADYVVNCGIFTVRCDIPVDQWEDFVHSMIIRMFSLCEVGIGFNLMTSYVDYQDDHLYYKSPLEIFDFCVKNLSQKVTIRHDYPLWEYFTFVYK